jgi:hypothetical protein
MADRDINEVENQPSGISAHSVMADLLLMSEDMVALAKNDEWDRVTELEELRRQALAQCFESPVALEHSALFSEALAAMLHLNEEVISLLEAAKQEVAIKRTDQIKVRRSIGHYLDVSDSH